MAIFTYQGRRVKIEVFGGGIDHVRCAASFFVFIDGKLVDKKSGSGAAKFEKICQTAYDLAVEAKKDEETFIKKYV